MLKSYKCIWRFLCIGGDVIFVLRVSALFCNHEYLMQPYLKCMPTFFSIQQQIAATIRPKLRLTVHYMIYPTTALLYNNL